MIDSNSPAAASSEANELAPVLVIIPTYNERENIEPIVARVHQSNPQVHVLIADDNSPDGTGEIADKLAADDDRVKVMHRAGKQGLGAAYIAGFQWGMANGYQVLIEMDADGSHRPEQLPDLLAALDRADMVIGSRWVPGGRTVGWPLSRRLISRAGSLYARLALGIVERDATGGFRAYRADAITRLGAAEVRSGGYSFQVEMLWRAVRAGLRGCGRNPRGAPVRGSRNHSCRCRAGPSCPSCRGSRPSRAGRSPSA